MFDSFDDNVMRFKVTNAIISMNKLSGLEDVRFYSRLRLAVS